MPTILFYLANQDRIAEAGEVAPQQTSYAEGLRERAAPVIFDAMEKPSIIGVARELGVCRPVARRALVAAGKVVA